MKKFDLILADAKAATEMIPAIIDGANKELDTLLSSMDVITAPELENIQQKLEGVKGVLASYDSEFLGAIYSLSKKTSEDTSGILPELKVYRTVVRDATQEIGEMEERLIRRINLHNISKGNYDIMTPPSQIGFDLVIPPLDD